MALALFMAVVLHGVCLLLSTHLVPSDEPDTLLDPVVVLSLTSELPVPAPPAVPPPPTAEPLPRPLLPTVPREEKAEKVEKGQDQQPARVGRRKLPQAEESGKSKGGKAAAARPEAPPPAKPAVPDAAAAPLPEKKVETPRDGSTADSPPAPIHQAQPEYPQRARQRGWEGTVIVEVLVDQEGSVGEARIVGKSGHEILDRAALDVVGNWRFSPGRKDGEKTARRVRVPIRFRLE